MEYPAIIATNIPNHCLNLRQWPKINLSNKAPGIIERETIKVLTPNSPFIPGEKIIIFYFLNFL